MAFLKNILAVFFLVIGVSLSAQTYREARVFVPPIIGAGGVSDNAYFYKQITYEVVVQHRMVVRSLRGSDYTLQGSIVPYTGQSFDDMVPEPKVDVVEDAASGFVPERPIPAIGNKGDSHEYFTWEVNNGIYFFDVSGRNNYQMPEPPEPTVTAPEPVRSGEYAFVLELRNSVSGEVIGRQYIIYSTVDESINRLISVVVYNMLTGVFDFPLADWRDKWVFVDIVGLWSPRIYVGVHQSLNPWIFGFRISAQFSFLDQVALGAGAQLVQENLLVSAGLGEYYDLLLEVPLSLRLVFKPAAGYMLEPYGGITFNFSMFGDTNPSFLSWFAGFQFGVKLGDGMLIIDPRVSMDLSRSYAGASDYQRRMLYFGFGYRFGFLSKTPKY